MRNSVENKIDGALGAMIIDDQPTHSIYHLIVSDIVNIVNNANRAARQTIPAFRMSEKWMIAEEYKLERGETN